MLPQQQQQQPLQASCKITIKISEMKLKVMKKIYRTLMIAGDGL